MTYPEDAEDFPFPAELHADEASPGGARADQELAGADSDDSFLYEGETQVADVSDAQRDANTALLNKLNMIPQHITVQPAGEKGTV